MRLLVSRVFSLSASSGRAPLLAPLVVGPRLCLSLLLFLHSINRCFDVSGLWHILSSNKMATTVWYVRSLIISTHKSTTSSAC